MKYQWTILLISALTDAIITFGTALTSAMVAGGQATMPGTAVLVLAGIGALVSFARTVQQRLNSDNRQSAAVESAATVGAATGSAAKGSAAGTGTGLTGK